MHTMPVKEMGLPLYLCIAIYLKKRHLSQLCIDQNM